MVLAQKGSRTTKRGGGAVVERDLGWSDALASIDGLADLRVHVGVIGDAPHRGAIGKTLVEVATINEYGAPQANIPERSFIRAAMDEGAVKIGEATRRLTVQLIDRKVAPRQALGLIGELAKSLIQRKIIVGPFIANAPATIAAKGSSKPLVDTGQLRASITYQILGGAPAGNPGGTP